MACFYCKADIDTPYPSVTFNTRTLRDDVNTVDGVPQRECVACALIDLPETEMGIIEKVIAKAQEDLWSQRYVPTTGFYEYIRENFYDGFDEDRFAADLTERFGADLRDWCVCVVPYKSVSSDDEEYFVISENRGGWWKFSMSNADSSDTIARMLHRDLLEAQRA